jgi:hypothetical protein
MVLEKLERIKQVNIGQLIAKLVKTIIHKLIKICLKKRNEQNERKPYC